MYARLTPFDVPTGTAVKPPKGDRRILGSDRKPITELKLGSVVIGADWVEVEDQVLAYQSDGKPAVTLLGKLQTLKSIELVDEKPSGLSDLLEGADGDDQPDGTGKPGLGGAGRKGAKPSGGRKGA